MKTKRARSVVLYGSVIVIAVIFLLPVFSVLVTSLTPEGLIFTQGTAFWPNHATMENFQSLFQRFPFIRWYANSTITATLFTIGQLCSCSMTAFAISHFTFRGRRMILILVLATMMLPFQVLMIPLFLIMKSLGWINTLWPLIVPSFFGDITGAVGIFLLRQAFVQIPMELSEAAYLDGANAWQVFQRIYLPLSKPFFTVLAILSFMTSWNDFSRPLVYISNQNMMTVTGGLSFFQTQYHIEWGPVMAGTLLSIIPSLVLYIVFQRYFVQIAMSSGLKG